MNGYCFAFEHRRYGVAGIIKESIHHPKFTILAPIIFISIFFIHSLSQTQSLSVSHSQNYLHPMFLKNLKQEHHIFIIKCVIVCL